MRCLCTKCKANIELKLDEIPEDGAFVKCSECSAGLLLRKESFACRALQKGDEITCAECGSTVGNSIYCQKCHAAYPDFYTTKPSSAAKKSLGKIFSKFTLTRRAKSSTAVFSDQQAATSNKLFGLRLPGKSIQIGAILLLAVLLAGGGGYYWYQNSIEAKYAEDYIRLLYGIKSVTDTELKTCTRIAADWKASMAPTPPALTKEELLLISRAKTDLDGLKKRLGDAPAEKFKSSSDALGKLYDSYKSIEAFTATPAGSLDSYAATAKKLEDDFRNSSKALKAGLPEKLVKQLEESKKRYKALQNF